MSWIFFFFLLYSLSQTRLEGSALTCLLWPTDPSPSNTQYHEPQSRLLNLNSNQKVFCVRITAAYQFLTSFSLPNYPYLSCHTSPETIRPAEEAFCQQHNIDLIDPWDMSRSKNLNWGEIFALPYLLLSSISSMWEHTKSLLGFNLPLSKVFLSP